MPNAFVMSASSADFWHFLLAALSRSSGCAYSSDFLSSTSGALLLAFSKCVSLGASQFAPAQFIALSQFALVQFALHAIFASISYTSSHLRLSTLHVLNCASICASSMCDSNVRLFNLHSNLRTPICASSICAFQLRLKLAPPICASNLRFICASICASVLRFCAPQICASSIALHLRLFNVRLKLTHLQFAPQFALLNVRLKFALETCASQCALQTCASQICASCAFQICASCASQICASCASQFAPLALLKFHFSECACSIASLRVSIALLNVRFQFALLQCALLQFAAFALVEFAPFALLQLCEIGSLPGLWGTSLCPLTNTHLCYAFFQICTSSMCASPIGTSHVGRHMLRLTQKPQRDGSSSVGSGFGLGRHRGANSVPILPDISPFEPTDDKSRISEWIERFKFALDCTAPTANDEVKVKCLMNKLSESAFSEYSRSVLPSSVTDFDFKVTTEKLEKLFAKAQSIFIDRYECLKAVRGEGEQFRQFINRHRKLLTDFKFDELTKEQFNCLMLLMALKAPTEAALRQRILTKLAADSANISYDGVVEDLISFQSTISEAKAIEATSSSRPVNAIRHNQKPNNSPKNSARKVQSRTIRQTNSSRKGPTLRQPPHVGDVASACIDLTNAVTKRANAESVSLLDIWIGNANVSKSGANARRPKRQATTALVTFNWNDHACRQFNFTA
ncbi:hypothetical protein niasHT_004498 [Heterodera trifolii]|uniref:DUF7083 domain-containing protein n=1 Tax=Heterodera trifolii TaxID=157864 RepID=A0ABD2ME29_9BILA